jgi:hypothetical protein
VTALRGRRQTPSASVCAIWIALSVFWIWHLLDRMRSFRAAGREVTGWQHAQVGIWVVILLVWCVLGWRALQQRNRREG